MNLMPKTFFQWLVVAVLVFAYVTSYNEGKQLAEQNAEKQGVEPVIKVASDKEKQGLSDKAANYFLQEFSKTEQGRAFVQSMAEKKAEKKYGDNDASLVNAIEKNKIVVVDKIIGQGNNATCGSKVNIHYVITSKYKVQIDSTKDRKQPLSFSIGEGASLKGIETGIVGMKKGGVRKIAIPPHLAYADGKFKNDLLEATDGVVVEVELLELENGKNPDLDIKNSVLVEGSGEESVICGSDVDLDYEDISGKTSSLSFKVGDKENHSIIGDAILGMKIGESRKLEIPSDLLKDDKTGLSILQKEDEQENLEIDVTLKNLRDSLK